MKQDIKKRWVKALRSGEYKQGRHFLCEEATGSPRFCCLGVLCDIELDDFWTRLDYWWEIDGSNGALSKDMMHRCGLSESDAQTLASKNDRGDDFNTIADYIEANL